MNCAGPSEEITDFLVHVSTCVYELCLSKLTHHPSQLKHFKGAISLIQLRANGQDGSRVQSTLSDPGSVCCSDRCTEHGPYFYSEQPGSQHCARDSLRRRNKRQVTRSGVSELCTQSSVEWPTEVLRLSTRSSACVCSCLADGISRATPSSRSRRLGVGASSNEKTSTWGSRLTPTPSSPSPATTRVRPTA